MVESGEQRQPHQERTRIADTLNKMREHLLSSESSTCASDAFLQVSRRVYFGWLLQLLYDAACCRHAQREKADDFINSLAGLNTDELGYWPKRIRNFASELKNRLKKNIFTSHDAACDNTEEDEAGFLWLHRIADRIESDIGLLKAEVGYRHEAYPKAIYTLREYMGSFRGMEALLNETNKVLEFSGYTFREKNLRDTYRHYPEVRASGE